MKQKLKKLSLWSLVLALADFVIAFVFFHFISPDGVFTPVFREDPGKPMVSLLFGIKGVLFLFSSMMSAIVNRIFFREEKKGSLV